MVSSTTGALSAHTVASTGAFHHGHRAKTSAPAASTSTAAQGTTDKVTLSQAAQSLLNGAHGTGTATTASNVAGSGAA